MTSWNTLSKDRKYQFFDEIKEKNWNEPFYFIQGADIQFGFIDRELKNKNVITWEEENALAENIVQKINQMNPKPRFFVMCGDLCDAMPDTESQMRKRQEYDYKQIFGKLDKDIPLINVCGNHDVGNVPTLETIKMFHSSFGDDYFSFYCGGILFLVLNSQYFFDSSKVQFLADEHSVWIDKKLEEAHKENMRVVIFQHIPWFLKTIDEDESYFTLSANIRKKWLDKFQKAGVEAVFCGHYHRNAGGSYKGIDVVVTSAVGGGDEVFSDETVNELKSLKSTFRGMNDSSENGGKVSEIIKSEISVFCNLNCNGSAHEEINSKVNKDGKMLGKIQMQKIDVIKNEGDKHKSTTKTEIYLPLEGIFEAMKNDADLHTTKEKSRNSGHRNNKFNNILEGKYRPRVMAEYIFWTGDEKSVALTIEEFLEQGLMSRQEAINFLQNIKFNLDDLQSQYQELEKPDFTIPEEEASDHKIKFENAETKETKNLYDKLFINPTDLIKVKSGSLDAVLESKQKLNDVKAESGTENSDEIIKNHLKLPDWAKSFGGVDNTSDVYEKMIEKLKERMKKTDELQEIIFKLAKTMFYESLIKGNVGAQKAMQKFSSFLQKEINLGLLSTNLEKRILGILLSALTDALSNVPK